MIRARRRPNEGGSTVSAVLTKGMVRDPSAGHFKGAETTVLMVPPSTACAMCGKSLHYQGGKKDEPMVQGQKFSAK